MKENKRFYIKNDKCSKILKFNIRQKFIQATICHHPLRNGELKSNYNNLGSMHIIKDLIEINKQQYKTTKFRCFVVLRVGSFDASAGPSIPTGCSV